MPEIHWNGQCRYKIKFPQSDCSINEQKSGNLDNIWSFKAHVNIIFIIVEEWDGIFDQ